MNYLYIMFNMKLSTSIFKFAPQSKREFSQLIHKQHNFDSP